MVRNAEPFELFEEDFLPERPAMLTSEQIQAMEIDPPGWALKANRKQGGKRHSKREKQYAADGWKAVGPYSMVPFTGPLAGGHLDGDEERLQERAETRHRRRHGGHGREPKEEQVPVPRGNLEDQDYRFWKGYPVALPPDKFLGVCKWCDSVVHSRAELKEHNKRGWCTEHLIALYRYAKTSSKSQWYCFACKRETNSKHWGIPLCKQNKCLSAWKFTSSINLSGYQQYREWALNAQARDPKNGPYAHLMAVDPAVRKPAGLGA